MSAPGGAGSERAVCALERDGVSGRVTIASSSFDATALRRGGAAERAGLALALRISLLEGGVARTSLRSSEAEAAIGNDGVRKQPREQCPLQRRECPDGAADAACKAAAVMPPAAAGGGSPALNAGGSAFRVMNALPTDNTHTDQDEWYPFRQALPS